MLCSKLFTSLHQVVDNLEQACYMIRLVTRLFQPVRYSHDITILLQPCVVNLATFLLYHDCITLVRTTLYSNKSDNAISLLQVVNSLFQTCHNKLGTSSANTTC